MTSVVKHGTLRILHHSRMDVSCACTVLLLFRLPALTMCSIRVSLVGIHRFCLLIYIERHISNHFHTLISRFPCLQLPSPPCSCYPAISYKYTAGPDQTKPSPPLPLVLLGPLFPSMQRKLRKEVDSNTKKVLVHTSRGAN